jgi:hypothetical protein
MKKILILSLVALSTLTADAQRRRTRANTSQGNWALGIAGMYDNSSEDPAGDSKTTGSMFSINPSIGYFVIDNLEVGLNANLGNEKSEDVTTLNPVSRVNTNTNNNAFGLYLRKYWPVNNWFAFTGMFDAGMNFGNGESKSYTGTIVTTNGVSNQGYNGNLNWGFAFTPSNNIALMANVAGAHFNSNVVSPNGANNDINNSNFRIGLTRQANLGIVWYFGRGMWRAEN